MLFYGRMLPSRELLGGRGWVVRIYGLAAWLWRLVVCVSLLAAASVLFKGAGLVLGVAGAACWFGKPLVQTVVRAVSALSRKPPLAAASRHRRGRPGGSSLRHAGLAAVAGDGHRAGRRRVYRSVHRAQRCCRVHRPDLTFPTGSTSKRATSCWNCATTSCRRSSANSQSALSQADVLHRAALDEHDAAKAQVALRNRQALVERLAEIQRQRDGLRVHAPVAGHIVARNLDNTIGTYVEEGAELLAVGDERCKELLVSVSHEQIEDIAASARTSRAVPHAATSASTRER